MDIQMPGLDGLEVSRVSVRARRERLHVPIIALTAHATKDDKIDVLLPVWMDICQSQSTRSIF